MMMSTHAYAPTAHTAITDHTLAEGDTREVIRSRLGEIVIDIRNALLFPRGMLGMNDSRHFALANFPSQRMQQFKLLQSLDDFKLSFIAMPLAAQNTIVEHADVTRACRELGINEDALVMLMLVCVHRGPDATRLSVNARAPVLLDARRKTGMQYVFGNDKYKVQHFIN